MRRTNEQLRQVPGLLLILGALTAFAPMSTDMYLPSLPLLRTALATDAASVQLTLMTFFIGVACGQLAYGPAADRFGRRPVLAVGVGVYVLASAGCALAGSVGPLIAWRLLQGLGGCAGVVVARAMVRDLYEPQESARIFSILMLVMGVAPIVAPLAGGWLLAAAGWRSIFWVLTAFGLACFAAAVWWLPETRRPATAGQVADGPLRVYAMLLRDPTFIRGALCGGLAQAGMFAYIAGSPFVYIELHHVPAGAYGWLFGANALGLIALSQANRIALARLPAHRLLGIGIASAAAAGVTLLAVVLAGAAGLAWIALPVFWYVASLGLVSPNAVAVAMAPFPERAGTASALLGTFQFGLAAIAAITVAGLGDATAMPMASVMAACGTTSLLAYALLPRRQEKLKYAEP